MRRFADDITSLYRPQGLSKKHKKAKLKAGAEKKLDCFTRLFIFIGVNGSGADKGAAKEKERKKDLFFPQT